MGPLDWLDHYLGALGGRGGGILSEKTGATIKQKSALKIKYDQSRHFDGAN